MAVGAVDLHQRPEIRMTSRATSLRYPEGTKTVGTARVREPALPPMTAAQRAIYKKTGNLPAASAGFDEIADGLDAGPQAKARSVAESAATAADIGKPASLGNAIKRLTKPVGPREAAKKALQALGRLKAGAMNKTEASYALHLEGLKRSGEVAWFRFEGMKFRLADNTFYTPDFAVMLSGGQLECHEVKGHWQDDARVKIKIVADQYPLKFIAVTAKPKKAGGGWQIEEF